MPSNKPAVAQSLVLDDFRRQKTQESPTEELDEEINILNKKLEISEMKKRLQEQKLKIP